MGWQFDNRRAIYAQIMERMTHAIVSGALSPGEKLLSVREFAEVAGVNPNTMQKALSELEETGLVYSNRTAGRFITEDTKKIAELRSRIAKEKADAFLSEMQALGFSKAEVLNLWNQKEE